MGNGSWKKEVDAYLERVFDLLTLHDGVLNIRQEPYKGDFFGVFDDAYRSGFCRRGQSERFDEKTEELVLCKQQRPRITGDAIRQYVHERGWLDVDETSYKRRYAYLDQVANWWDEWAYAYKHNPPKRKYRRR